jgi:MinD superfamily P-loop ATPase
VFMKKIAIVSGKGGVGKTSISAALAFGLKNKDKNIIVIDTDVDAPNLALVLKGKLLSRDNIATSEIAEIDLNLCTNCGICIEQCKSEAIKISENNALPKVIPYFCEGCGVCKIVCPEKAISMLNRINGFIDVFKTKYDFYLISGQLDIGGVASGKIVEETKEKGYSFAKEDTEYIIIDGPPGSGCPAISAISDVDFVIFTTEPTPTALHDLKRIVKVNRSFNIPSGVIINKYDIHRPNLIKLEEYLVNEGINIIGRLKYDDIIPKSIVAGKPFNEIYPNSELTKEFKIIIEKLINAFNG